MRRAHSRSTRSITAARITTAARSTCACAARATSSARSRSTRDVADALERWRELRDEIPELAGDPRPVPAPRPPPTRRQLPRRRRPLSTSALIRIVRPIMLPGRRAARAGAPAHAPAHLRPALHGRPASRALALQRIMGHASPETTSRYVHHDDHELAAEHRRIERLRQRSARPPPTAPPRARRHARELTLTTSRNVCPNSMGGIPERGPDGHRDQQRRRRITWAAGRACFVGTLTV